MPNTIVARLCKWFLPGLMLMLITFGIFATAYAQGGDAARGRQLFLQNCAVCHGENAQGRVGARLAKDFPGIRVDASLNATISNGVQGSVMPAWSQAKGGPLSDAQINDLVAYIQSLGHQASPAPTNALTPTAALPLPSPVATFPAGDAQRGATLFAQNCVVCHGDRGQGRIGATLAKDWSGIQPTTFIEATIARGVPNSKMPAWGAAYGGPLNPQEIADIATYVRSLKQPAVLGTPAAPVSEQPSLLSSPLTLICGGLLILLIILVLGVGLARSRV